MSKDLMPVIGLTLDRSTNFMPAGELAALAQRIERLGFESIWLLDAFGRDPFLASAFILSQTATVKVGTGVATVYSRDAMAAVQTREALSELYPGRFIMGLGASNPIVIAKRKGEWIAPLPKMTAYLQDMAEVQLAALRPSDPAPVYVAAHAPGLQKLAVTHAQGMITWMMPSGIIADARERVGPDFPITAQIVCVMSADAETARAAARGYLAMYLALPYYQTAFAKAGFDPAECTDGGGSDRLIDSVTAWGSAADIRARIEEFHKAGANRVVLNVVGEDVSKREAGKPPVIVGDYEQLEMLAPAVLSPN